MLEEMTESIDYEHYQACVSFHNANRAKVEGVAEKSPQQSQGRYLNVHNIASYIL